MRIFWKTKILMTICQTLLKMRITSQTYTMMMMMYPVTLVSQNQMTEHGSVESENDTDIIPSLNNTPKSRNVSGPESDDKHGSVESKNDSDIIPSLNNATPNNGNSLEEFDTDVTYTATDGWGTVTDQSTNQSNTNEHYVHDCMLPRAKSQRKGKPHGRT